MLHAFILEIVWWLLGRVEDTYSFDRAQKRASRTAKLVTGLTFRRSVVELQPGIGGKNEIRDDWFWIIRRSTFRFPLYFYSFSPTVSSLSVLLFLHVFTSASFHQRMQTACHPFRRFCPPPRRTINFLDLNPGLCATTTTTTTTIIDRFRFHGAYRTLSVEMRLVPASCALVYRSDDIFTRSPRSNLNIRFNSLRHPQREPHVYLALFLRGESY